MQAWWLRELAGLGRLGRVLEIGAGAAAAVASLVATHFPGTEVIASDYREMPVTGIRGITQVGNAPIESLPFPDAHIDVLTSQFAFEYASRAAAVAELARVIRPGGAARMLMHHPGSFFSRQLVHRVRTLSAGAGLAKAQGDAQSVRQSLHRLNELIDSYSKPPVFQDVLDDLKDFAAVAYRFLDGGSSEAEIAADRALLAQCAPSLLLAQLQIKACSTSEQMQDLLQLLKVRGFHAASCMLPDGRGQPLAWAVRLHR